MTGKLVLYAIVLCAAATAAHFSDMVRKRAKAVTSCRPCSDDQLLCDNCRCVMKSYFCDHDNDCGDNSDEPLGCKSSPCNGTEYKCDNGKCISHTWLCDGSNDCDDNSDEKHCMDVSSACSTREYQCPLDNSCISLAKLCGGYASCQSEVANAPCDAYFATLNPCKSSPVSSCPNLDPAYTCNFPAPCKCSKGYVVDELNKSYCVDYNECEDFGTCDQKCTNTVGGYQCSCRQFFTLENNHTCKVAGVNAKLYVGTETNITRMNLNGTDIEHMVSGSISDLDYEFSTQTLFWIDNKLNKVYKSDSGDNGKTELNIEGLPKPCSLSYDWMGHNLYIVDCLAKRIALYNVISNRQKNVINDGIQNCRSVAVDPTRGYMFYTDYGRKPRHLPRIVRAFMDGSSRVDLKLGKVVSPSSLSLDIINRRLYWTDYRLDVIYTVDYDGLHRQTIISGGLHIPAPVSLAMFDDQLYWADITKMAVLQIGKFHNNGHVTTVWQPEVKPSVVKIEHVVMQKFTGTARGSDPWSVCKTKCQHLCVLTHTTDNNGLGYRCMCEAGYQLMDDATSCKRVEEFLMFATKHSIRSIPLDGTMSHAIDAMKPIVGQRNTRRGNSFVAIDYDVRERELYFSDIYNKAIFKSPLDEIEIKPLLAKDIRSVEGLSLDWISRNLYFTDFYAKTVSVMRLDNPDERKVLLTGLGSPRSVVVHPNRGYVFFADWLKNASSHPFIGRCHGDGSNVTEIHRYELGWPNGMCVDYVEDRVYWVDAYFDRLQHTDLDGKDLQTAPGLKLVHPFGVAVFREFIYLTDWKLRTITRVSKQGGNVTTLLRGVQYLRSVRIYSKDLQNIPDNHPCVKKNGRCSHFCFPVPGQNSTTLQRVCGCPFGMKLTTNNVTCENNPKEVVKPACDGSKLFKCKTGRCIVPSFRCDRDDDCMDNSDEENCRQDKECFADKFRCANGKCVNKDWKCDGDDDCGDMSDEAQCPNKTCAPQEFQCNNTLCIHIRFKCNTDNDCGDGSDEGQLCENHKCHLGYYQCRDKRCIPERLLCDGDEDCHGGEDELNCPPLKCPGNGFKCTTVRQCVPVQYRCDGALDCRDDSDEKHCPRRPHNGCHRYEFKCGTGGCIPRKWKCDGQSDCEDMSDEAHCSEVTCPPSSFRCTNGRCISRNRLCNKQNDCGDNSDEDQSKICPPPPFVCPLGQWECPGTEVVCINNSKICDGNEDCPGGHDETSLCDQNDCGVDNGGCSFKCVQTPRGPKCVCPAGQRLNGTKICVDTNECSIAGACSQTCVNIKGTYKCSCDKGYVKLADGKHCAAQRNKVIPKLIVCTKNRITVTGVDSWNTMEALPIPGARALAGVDIHVEQKRIFASDSKAMKVFSMNLDGSNITEVLSTRINVIEDLAVDWVGGNLYWNDYTLETVEVARLDGTNRMILFSENVTHPRGIELDPREGVRLIFWSDWGQNPRIESAGMDGSGRMTVISTKLYWPNGLSLDYPTKRLYFADARMDYIEFCNYDGSGRQQVIANDHFLRHPHDLVVFEDYITWTDRAANRISRCNKFNCTNKNVIGSKMDKPIGIVVYHPVKQPSAPNPCSTNPCSHICLLSPVTRTGYKCGCPLGMELSQASQLRCVKATANYLLYGYKDGISSIKLPIAKGNIDLSPLTSTKNIVGIDYDSENGNLFLVQELNGFNMTVRTLKMFTSNETLLAPTLFVGNPSSISYDWVAKNLFWTDAVAGTIEMMSVAGNMKYRKVILSDMGRDIDCVTPVAVVADPSRGVLYWADTGGHGVRAKIASMQMDGARRRIINQRRVDWPSSLSRDTKSNDLYWTEGRRQQLMRWEYSTRKVTVILDELGKPNCVSLYAGSLFYADSNFETLSMMGLKNHSDVTVVKKNLKDIRAVTVYYNRHNSGITNGCATNNGGCSQICLPTSSSSIRCECGVGFKLGSSGGCEKSDSFVIVSQLGIIHGYAMSRGDHDDAMVPVGGTGRLALQVDVHMAGNHIYWCEGKGPAGVSGIHRVMPDGSHHDHIVIDGIGMNGIKGIAVDWIAGNLYFSNVMRSETYIEVSRLDGSNRLVLIKDSENVMEAVAVNPIKRYLYWVDGGQFPRIERSFLDGSNRTAMVTTGIVKPRGITVDILTHDVYWTDTSVDAIQKVSFLGGERKYVKTNLPNPYDVAIFKDDILWVDRNLNNIFKGKKQSHLKLAKIVKGGLLNLNAVAVFDKDVQPNVTNPCSFSNGGCEQLCFMLPNRSEAVCACATGLLSEDNKTCHVPKAYLIYAVENDILSSSLDMSVKSSMMPPKRNLSGAVAVDFDYKDETIFFSAIGIKRIGLVKTGSVDVHNLTEYINSTVTVPMPLIMGEGLSYDWINKKLYVADSSRNQILTMHANGTNKSSVASVHSPRAVAVNPCRGYLFWSQWGIITQIERSTLIGTQRKSIITTDLGWPNGLTIDFTEGTLYWVDAKKDRIERCDFEGFKREVIVQTTVHPFSVAVFGQFVYWTDWILHGVYRAEKHTGANLTVVTSGLTKRPMGIAVYRNRSRTCSSNPCNLYNGGCSDKCTVGAQGKAVCSCRNPNLVLAANTGICQPVNNVCNSTDFACPDGTCLGPHWVCDGDWDCKGGEDENVNMCAMQVCQTGFFRCASGRCIPKRFVCDHDNDCRDNSDEQGCTYPLCGTGQFTCSNFRCIDVVLQCNGIDNCRDSRMSDELKCSKAPVKCDTDFVKCPNTNVCVPRRYLCDGDNDCGNNEDESLLFCQHYSCPDGDFHCTMSHQCIPGLWHCDGARDCKLGEDEPGNCSSVSRSCTKDQFSCDNGKCISQLSVCDATNDCGDLSDEKVGLKCELRSCPQNSFTCQSNKAVGRYACINKNEVCDGVRDCTGGEDENGCTKPTCSSGEFVCNNSKCIPDRLRCDHVDDCGDFSDEPSDCDYVTCSTREFKCNNKRCIPQHWVCDKEDDCLDFSDEKPGTCSTPVPACEADMFRCETGICINQSDVCNKKDDCDDYSDEKACGVNECKNNVTNQCTHKCIDLASGYKCDCNQGYSLMKDKRSCEDVNECLDIPGVCSQQCINTEGSYTCKCNEEYRKRSDGKTCKRIDNVTPWLIFTNRFYIREITTDGENSQKIADDFNNAVALDYLYEESMLYFTDVGAKKIYKMALNGTSKETIVDNGIEAPEGLAVDWIGRKIYWIDAKLVAIMVAELNGTNMKTLFKKDILKRPRALVVSPSTGYAYWSDWTRDSYIGRIGMDGSNPTKVIKKKLGWPNALTIDFETNRLWWGDAHLDRIEFANADGTNRHVVRRSVPHPFAMTVFDDTVYWTDWNHLTLEKCNKYTGKNFTRMLNTTHRPMDLHIYHPLRQKPGKNPCGTNNGGCSNLCLIAPGGVNFTCACPDNFYLDDDNSTCKANCSITQIRCGHSDDRCVPRQWQCDGSPDCKDGADEPNTCPAANCSPGQFRCRNGNCTYSFQTCDLVDQCGDGSDEEECEKHVCEKWQFKCKNHKCIPKTWKCDKVDDCGDNSDEASTLCHKRTCEAGKFMCDNGRCIQLSWQCDFDDDCGDNSDEKPEFGCHNRTCKQGWWKCMSNYRCIPDWQRCNGRDDCRDNSDEETKNCPKCHPTGDFQCTNKRCVPKRWMCDFDNDCGDMSDEDKVMCAPLYRNCSETEVRCKNQKCIRSKWQCDHDNDCGDNSDEDQQTCKKYPDCSKTEFQCSGGQCINKMFVCNGVGECPDLSDEVNCTSRFPREHYCPQNEFECKNHICIPLPWRCDAQDDCGDQSDETEAVCREIKCPQSTHFLCNNKKCIPNWQLCDNTTQCGDGSDENNQTVCTPKKKLPCTTDEYKCTNDRCISVDKLCNNVNDCDDDKASDELECGKQKGKTNCSVENGGCEHNCTDVKGGFYCTCKPGFVVDEADSKTCVDIDECFTIKHGCPQLCSNVKGSYKCQCAVGFKDVKGQGRECKAEEFSRTIFFATLNEIRQYRPDKKKYSGSVTRRFKITSLDIDIGKRLLYWTDSVRGEVLRAPIPEKPNRLGIAQNIEIKSPQPYGIAVDWVENNIYWTDVRHGTISVSLFDGRYQRTLIDGLGYPLAVAVNPNLGYMYWTDCYPQSPKIERSWMSGEQRETLVSTRLVRPSALTIDYTMDNRIYWADYKQGIVESVKADGTDRVVVLVNVFSPVSLDVFETKIYWVSQKNGSAFYQNKFGIGNSTVLQTGLIYPSGVRVFHRLRVDLAIKPRCPQTGDRCSHLCLLVPGSYKCACPEDTTFQGDSKFLCDAASEEAKAEPKMCACWNNGECVLQENGTNICHCLEGFSGNLCENIEPKKLSSEPSISHLTVILVPSVILFLLALAVIAMFVILKRKGKIMGKLKSSGSATYKEGGNVEISTSYQIPTSFPAEMSENSTSTNFCNPMYETLNGKDPYIKDVQETGLEDGVLQTIADPEKVSQCALDNPSADKHSTGAKELATPAELYQASIPKHLDAADDLGKDTGVLVTNKED